MTAAQSEHTTGGREADETFFGDLTHSFPCLCHSKCPRTFVSAGEKPGTAPECMARTPGPPG
ncbi:hypothetical protein GCM10018773_44110 [Streptomyces candidus]|nr:hypothetical protein GCM10018773_44110 [Streptomyces candidus]